MIRMKRIGALTVIAISLFASPASAALLVTPQGQPVGGKWQRWADQSHMPIFHMTVGLVITSSSATTAECGPHPGCVDVADRPPTIWFSFALANAHPTTYAIQDLYHELGHVFDWYYLTDPTRHQLERTMGDQGQGWSEANVPHGGASDDFANIYAGCSDTPPRLRHRFSSSWITVCRIIQHARYSNTPGAFATGAIP